MYWTAVDNFETVVGENPSCYGILPLWDVNGLSIVCLAEDTVDQPIDLEKDDTLEYYLIIMHPQ